MNRLFDKRIKFGPDKENKGAATALNSIGLDSKITKISYPPQPAQNLLWF
jgi:hypothetical protein